jgi:DNA uptake protein ComE-like DNA-binding protein
LNSADSAKLTELKGIGPSFARRIVNYRNRLGGFISKEQLKEVFGMDDDRYAEMQGQVSVDPTHIQKIHINKVDFDGLKKFPYLSFKQMNAIVQFREQHGDYSSLNDMRNIAILNDEILRKIEPYIDFK